MSWLKSPLVQLDLLDSTVVNRSRSLSVSASSTVRSCDGRGSSAHNVHTIHGDCHPFGSPALRISSFLLPGDTLVRKFINRSRGSPAKSLHLFDPFAQRSHYHHPPLQPIFQSRAGDINTVRHGVSSKRFQCRPFTNCAEENAQLERVLQERHSQGGHRDR